MAFRPKRQRRYRELKDSGFLPFEAQALSSVPLKKAPFMRQMVRDRRALLIPLRKEADFANWSRTRYEKEKTRLIGFEYKEKGLIFQKISKQITKGKGRPDPWQLFRYYRDKAIEEGTWAETPRRTHRQKRFDEHGIRIEKGDVKKQKERRRDREKQKKERGY